jgi:hypothetical protein
MTDKQLVYHQDQFKEMKKIKETNFNNEHLYEVGTYYKKKLKNDNYITKFNIQCFVQTLCPELIQKRIKERVLLKKLIKSGSKKCKSDNQRAKVKKNCG